MKTELEHSETFEPVTDDIALSAGYTDIVLLRSGANACIYRAVRAGKRLLLKVPNDGTARKLEMLKREYSIAAGLDHHNIARVYTWDAATPVGPAIVMEYVDGVTLKDVLLGKPSIKTRRRIFAQILEAIQYLHSLSVIHNDLKPANIMISRVNGDVKIIDFGFADNDAEFLQRKLGGTRGYASPELMTATRDSDSRSDIYSLGMLMRELFGRHYGSISRRCLNNNPDRRYHDVMALGKAWRRRLQLPYVAVASVIAFTLTAVVALMAININELKSRLHKYESMPDAALLAESVKDSLDHYAVQTSLLHDSISRMNSRISESDQRIASFNQLKEEYFSGARLIAAKHLEKLRNYGISQYLIPVSRAMTAELERYRDNFSAKHGTDGERINQEYYNTILMNACEQLSNLSQQLPGLTTLLKDPTNPQEVAKALDIINGLSDAPLAPLLK